VGASALLTISFKGKGEICVLRVRCGKIDIERGLNGMKSHI
jgi:hypothetical protein